MPAPVLGRYSKTINVIAAASTVRRKMTFHPAGAKVISHILAHLRGIATTFLRIGHRNSMTIACANLGKTLIAPEVDDAYSLAI
jgi:hypothetical protein